MNAHGHTHTCTQINIKRFAYDFANTITHTQAIEWPTKTTINTFYVTNYAQNERQIGNQA